MTSSAERASISLIAATAGFLGASVVAGFTAYSPVDRCWTAAFAVLVVLAAARATLTPVLLLTAAAVGVTIGSIWLIAPVAALMLGIIALRQAKTPPWHLAAISALSVTALLHPAEGASTLLVTLLVIVGAVPVLISGVRHGAGEIRRRVRLAGMLAVAFIAVSVITGVVLSALATPSLRNAVASSRTGVTETKSGDLAAAAGAFESAETDYVKASGFIDSLLMAPAKLIPVIGANLNTATEVIGAGRALASTAQATVSAAPYDTLHLADNGVDLNSVVAMQEPVAALSAEVKSVQNTLDGIDRSWLFPPVASRVDDFAAQVTGVSPQIETASMALNALPELLGATTPRSYLVEFTSESESRFLGGFVGSYALLSADHGHLTLDRSSSVATLNSKLGSHTDYVAPIQFRDLYDRFHPQMFAQNWTVSPDLPSDVAMVEQLFAKATGVAISGVIVIDPFGLASLLKITGPIRVDGIKKPLTADNAADYLLHGQYLEFAGQTSERRDQLAAVGQKAFDELLRSSKTNYREIQRALGPSVTDGHIMFSVTDPTTQVLFDRLGLTSRFELPSEGGMFSFRNSASFANKIDYFLQRSIAFDSTIDPSTSQMDSDVTIELRNDAPNSGLPAYVIGNDNGEPTGTNGMYFSIYTSLRLNSATLDGQAVDLSEQPDRGIRVFSRGITIPAGATRVLRFHLSGVLQTTSAGYAFQLPHQPTVNDDHLSFSVRSTDPAHPISSISGLGDSTLRSNGGVFTADASVTSNQTIAITFAKH